MYTLPIAMLLGSVIAEHDDSKPAASSSYGSYGSYGNYGAESATSTSYGRYGNYGDEEAKSGPDMDIQNASVTVNNEEYSYNQDGNNYNINADG